MADFEHTHRGVPGQDMPPVEGGLSLTMMAQVTGALVSLALVVGIGVWGYKLLMRDVSGVPVVRALAGEMRVAPSNPGGLPADHQGLAVNAVAAQGSAAAPADELKLAPRPVELTEEDAPHVAPATLRPAPDAIEASAPSDEAVAAFREGAVDALVAELTRGVEPMAPRDAAEPAATAQDDAFDAPETPGEPEMLMVEDDATDEIVVDPADIRMLTLPGVKRSLRPKTRPAGLERLASNNEADVAAAISSAMDASAGIDVDPATLPVGTRLAQLGAFDSEEVARTAWDGIAERFEGYLDDKSRVIQQATSGGRTFYRLRAMGFDDLGDARRFCSALVAGGADCIPVTTR